MTRDIETLRRKLDSHRNALRELQADAPSDALAHQYEQLALWIEQRLAALEVEPAEPALPPVAAPIAAAEPEYAPPEPWHYQAEPRKEGFRTAAVLLIGLAAAALLAFLFFRFFADREESPSDTYAIEEPAVPADATPLEEPETRIVEETPPAAQPPDPRVAPTPAGISDVTLSIEPRRANASGFGAGRAIQQFRIANNGSDDARISVERSACRCLWYDVQPVVPAGGAVVLEVTIDGARLEGDRLDERIGILDAASGKQLAEIEISGFR